MNILPARADSTSEVALDTVADIETPEHVRFRYRIAGPSRRLLAYLLDLVVRTLFVFVFAIIAIIGGAFRSDDLGQMGTGVMLLLLFVVEWGYYLFWELVWNGQTPGKKAFKLRVVSAEGHPLTFVQTLLRNLVRAADFLPNFFAVGLVVMASDKRFRRLGDMVAGTIVVVEDASWLGEPIVIDPPPLPDELSRLPSRLPLSGDELETIEVYLRRAARLGHHRQDELADMIAPVFAKRLGVGVRHSGRFLALLHWRSQHTALEEELHERPKKKRKKGADPAYVNEGGS